MSGCGLVLDAGWQYALVVVPMSDTIMRDVMMHFFIRRSFCELISAVGIMKSIDDRYIATIMPFTSWVKEEFFVLFSARSD